MAHVENIYRKNFLEYASYVIKERAIPNLIDGFKPVQRRIIHSLIEMDDGKFHKVANVVGHCMKYHPHGDSSIYEALVNLANCDIFIDKQGNFGNAMTGDSASAARYIECRILPIAKKVLYHPALVEKQESYDGRALEPIIFPAKIPILLMQGSEGIAVAMSTKILPHNPVEVLDACIKSLKGESFSIYPDFSTGAMVDVSEYDGGKGSVLIRAKLNTKDDKKIIIEEVPFGVTTEAMIKSIDEAAKKGKLKISSINDYTTDKVNIEIQLARGTYSSDIVDALYAYTRAQEKISCNPLVIDDNFPEIIDVNEMINRHTKHLIKVLKAELEFEKNSLLDKLHARTLERIFVEERIYKRIEQKRSSEAVIEAVISGFSPYSAELIREVTVDDVDILLKIPIRRISLFDIEKNREEIEQINTRIAEIEKLLKNLVAYAIDYIKDIRKYFDKPEFARKTTLSKFSEIKEKEVAERNLMLRYDPSSGALGHEIKGKDLFEVSSYDRILFIRNDGTYCVTDAIDKINVGKSMAYCSLSDKEVLEGVVFTTLYVEKATKALYIKRCKITQFILNKNYTLLPNDDDYKMIRLSTFENAEVQLEYKPKKGQRINEESILFSDYSIKGVKALGIRITTKDLAALKIIQIKGVVNPKNDDQQTLF